MNKIEIINLLSNEINMSKNKLKQIISSFENIILEKLKQGEKIKFCKLGVFYLKQNKCKYLYSPNKKCYVKTQPKISLRFRSSKKLKFSI